MKMNGSQGLADCLVSPPVLVTVRFPSSGSLGIMPGSSWRESSLVGRTLNFIIQQGNIYQALCAQSHERCVFFKTYFEENCILQNLNITTDTYRVK